MGKYLVNTKEDLKNHKGFKWTDLVKQVFPKADDQISSMLLWEFTGYMGGDSGCWDGDDHVVCCLKQLERVKEITKWDGDPKTENEVNFKPFYDELEAAIKEDLDEIERESKESK